MKINAKEMLNRFSFIDYKVTDVSIYPNTKSIIFSLNGASYLDNNVRKELAQGYLKIEHYTSIKITSYNAITKETMEVEIGKQEKMDQLCEVDIIKNKLIFKGYAEETFHWLEFEIEEGTMDGNFLDD
jgi:hypothetical protein